MTWTVYADVTNRWIGEDLTATESQVTTLIADAEDTVLRAFPTIQTRIDAIDNTKLPIARVIKVVSRMVIRHLRNPTGQRSTAETRGPNQMTVTYGGDEPGALYLTPEDIRELQPLKQSKRAFMIDTTPEHSGYFYEWDGEVENPWDYYIGPWRPLYSEYDYRDSDW